MNQGPSPLALIDQIALPALPAAVARLNALLADPEVGTREIGTALGQDPSLAGEVLRIANSASSGLRERVLSTEHAAAVLGSRTLRNIALHAAVVSRFEHLEGHGFDLERQWKHSILCAQLCRNMAQHCRSPLGLGPEEFYTCGLLHDLGKVVLLEALPDTFLEAVNQAVEQKQPLHEAEEACFGFNHAELGARIALRWNLHPTLVSAIQYHHGPEDEIEAEPAVALVELANRAAERAAEADQSGALRCLDRERAELLQLDPKAYFGAVAEAIAAWPAIEV